MPGTIPGQIYTYPRPRWRKKRRQYLTMNNRAFARAADTMLDGDADMHNISQIENPALQDTDSKDSQLLKDEVAMSKVSGKDIPVLTLCIKVTTLCFVSRSGITTSKTFWKWMCMMSPIQILTMTMKNTAKGIKEEKVLEG